jgi:hypothetical protein
MADNRNLSGDKPIDSKNLEQANQSARHEQAKSSMERGLETGANVDGAPVVPSAPPNTEVRPSIFSRMVRPKSAEPADPFDAPEFKEKKENKEINRPEEQNSSKEKTKEQIKAAMTKTPAIAAGSPQKKQAEPVKKVELPKTVFGEKAYIKKDLLKYSLWKSDDLKKMTKLGRHDRSGLAQEFFPNRNFVRKDDVQMKIRKIESGKDKPPKALGTGRIARTRAANVLRGMIGEKQKRVF